MTLPHLPTTPCWCLTMKVEALMPVHLAPSTPPAQGATRTMIASMSGARASRSWRTCMEVERSKTSLRAVLLWLFSSSERGTWMFEIRDTFYTLFTLSGECMFCWKVPGLIALLMRRQFKERFIDFKECLPVHRSLGRNLAEFF